MIELPKGATRINRRDRQYDDGMTASEMLAIYGIGGSTLRRAKAAGIVSPHILPAMGIGSPEQHIYTDEDAKRVMAWAMNNQRRSYAVFGRYMHARPTREAAPPPPTRKCICGKPALYYDDKTGRRACRAHKHLLNRGR